MTADDDYSDEEDFDVEAGPPAVALTAPNTYTYPLELLFRYIEKKLIKLDPEYQRDVVWSDKKQGHLIDSILKNFYIPPLIFSKTDPKPEAPRSVIDGKQRLTSIYRFMNNEIPHIDSHTGQRRWFEPGAGRRKNNCFSEQERVDFRGKKIMCVEYELLTRSQEEEIFSRVQMGMALSTAEKMFAISGPLGEFVRKLLDNYHRLLDVVDRKRKRDFLLLVQAYLVVRDAPVRLPSSTDMNNALKDQSPLTKRDKVLMDGLIRVFDSLMVDYPEIAEKQRLAPIEFVMFCYLIAMKDAYSLPELRESIIDLRRRIREKHIDIRANQKVYSDLKDMIEKLGD